MKKLGKNLNVVKESVEAYSGIGICICGCGCSCSGSGGAVLVYINNATSSSYNSSFGYRG